MENNADYIELTGRVRRPQNRTSPQRRYLSTNVHDRIYLKSIRDHASRLLDVCTSYCRAISCDSRCCSVHYSTVRQIEGSFSNNSWARKWLIESNNTILAKWNQDVDDVLSRIKSIMNNWHYSFFFLEINNE